MKNIRSLLLLVVIGLSLILTSSVLAAVAGFDTVAPPIPPGGALALLSEQTGLEVVSTAGGPGCQYQAAFSVYLCPAPAPASQPLASQAARQQALNTWSTDGLLLIPDSNSKRVMAFDPQTGDLLDADFIPADSAHLATPINAILHPTRGSFLVSDQIGDAVFEYGFDGGYLGLFAPAAGVDPAFMSNVRGIAFHSDNRLLVTVAEGSNAQAVISFSSSGDFYSQFIPPGSGGLAGPFDVYQRSADWLVSSIDSDSVLRFDLGNGSYIGIFAPINNFPEQVAEAANGNVLVANFSGTLEGIVELSPAGTLVGKYDPDTMTGYRGVYELPNGNLLITTSNGVFEISRLGTLVSTKLGAVNARFIEYIPPVADLTVTASGDSTPVLLGGSLNYNVQVTNNGPVTATNVILTNTLPIYPGNSLTSVVDGKTGYECTLVGSRDIVCRIDTLAPGEPFSISYRINTPGNAGGYAIHAQAASDVLDLVPANNRATAATLVYTPFEVHDCGVPYNAVGNCGFETNTFNGWVAQNAVGAIYPISIVGPGATYWSGFFSSLPTEGSRAVVHDFDANAPSQATLSQDLVLPANSGALRFDYRVAWDLVNYIPTEGALSRDFRVQVQPYGGGAALQETVVFSITTGTIFSDTGNLTGRVDISGFAGQPVRLQFLWNIPEYYTGPAFFQLDNIDITQPSMQYSPGFLSSQQPPGRIKPRDLTLYNSGDGAVAWSLQETLLVQSLRQSAASEALAAPPPNQAVLPDPASAADTVDSPISMPAPATPVTPAPAVFVYPRPQAESSGQYSASQPNIPSAVLQPEALLFDNGSFVTHPITGVSELQTDLNMSAYGFGVQVVSNNRVADDFTIPPGQVWQVDQVAFYAYQTGSGTISTLTGVNFRIWDGPPGAAGSSLLWGNTYDNRLIATSWMGVYRVPHFDHANTLRPVMLTFSSGGFALPSGTYWVDWQMGGSLTSGPFIPPITILGQTATGNALQSLNGGSWNPALDGQSLAPQGLPFTLYGTVVCSSAEYPAVSLPVPGGIVPAHASERVPVLFDSYGLQYDDVISGQLCLFSTDPFHSVLRVPWELVVSDYYLYAPLLRR